MKKLIIVTGKQGVGKTTLCHKLAGETPNSLYVEVPFKHKIHKGSAAEHLMYFVPCEWVRCDVLIFDVSHSYPERLFDIKPFEEGMTVERITLK